MIVSLLGDISKNSLGMYKNVLLKHPWWWNTDVHMANEITLVILSTIILKSLCFIWILPVILFLGGGEGVVFRILPSKLIWMLLCKTLCNILSPNYPWVAPKRILGRSHCLLPSLYIPWLKGPFHDGDESFQKSNYAMSTSRPPSVPVLPI